MRHGIKLSKKQSPKTDEELKRMSDIPYASAVGSIQYFIMCTRPYVAYGFSVTNRYQACAGEAHWSTVKIILKYLKRTKDIFLIYGVGVLILEATTMLAFSRTMTMPSPNQRVVIFCNNNEAKAQAKEPRSHHRFNYILRRYHLLREMVSRGDVRMDRVNSAENTADPLTKPILQIAHTQHLDKMGLRSTGD
ncbi:UNVERIFIED_CONTAM: Retrovirus-related Pol polyprotein from transposon TNT 1-94 [Sesamum latifolium]|uniref:Retrovirus-related Pol polyprotein from transposon TNT 1-94 n=1 Tax=Sesamum latifolium TaxID=2727402 RepID=A0AAW2Y9U8_9LAMI